MKKKTNVIVMITTGALQHGGDRGKGGPVGHTKGPVKSKSKKKQRSPKKASAKKE